MPAVSPTHWLIHNDVVSKVNGHFGQTIQSAVQPVPVVSCVVHANTSALTRSNLMLLLVVLKDTILNGVNGVLVQHHVKEDLNIDDEVTPVMMVWIWKHVTVVTSVIGSTGPCGLPVPHLA